MATIKHILFPFDFSEQASQAAPFVSAMAKRHAAQVTLMGVVPPIWDYPVLGMPVVTSGVEPSEAELKTRLEETSAKELGDIAAHLVTASGDPAMRIADFANDPANHVDLIMMGTHGTGLFRSMLIGSVTAKVMHDAKCPIWTATHAEEQNSPPEPKTVLCAVDGTPETPALIQWAAEFSRTMGASLKLLHVVPPLSDWLALASEREIQEQVREEARAKIEAMRKAVGVDATIRVAVGQIADTVAEEARQEGADLVVVGRGTLPAALGRIRTHVYGIIQRSPCPVLSV